MIDIEEIKNISEKIKDVDYTKLKYKIHTVENFKQYVWEHRNVFNTYTRRDIFLTLSKVIIIKEHNHFNNEKEIWYWCLVNNNEIYIIQLENNTKLTKKEERELISELVVGS